MRGIQKVKDNLTGLQKPDGTLTESDKEAADVLGNCIHLMFTKEVVSNQDNQENNSQELRTIWKDESFIFSVAKVTTKLRRLNTDKSAGPDGMHQKLLSSCVRAIAEPLFMIYCASYSSGVIPEDWKKPP